jgi:hypothetical protein
MIKHDEQGLPLPTLAEQLARKAGSSVKQVITEDEVTALFKAYILNKKQRKKL